MKKNYLFTLLGIMSFALSACSKKIPESIDFTLKDLGTAVEIHTEEQIAFLNSTDPSGYVSTHSMDLATFSKSAPNAITFSWENTINNGDKPSKYIVEIKDSYDTVKVETKNTSVDVYNLKVNTEYKWTVSAYYDSKNIFTSSEATFVTGQAPRNIKVEGMENVRDLGGWDVGEGKIYKQGMIYRSAELNGDKDGLSKPTKEGKRVLLEDLKIKSDIDLRKTKEAFDEDEVCGITSSPLGNNVNYVSCPMVFGHSNIFSNSKNVESLKKFFEYLAVKDNYPMVFHCVRGTDRTGGLAYAISAMCGVSKTDLMKDYLFSNFANINSSVITEDDINKPAFYVYQINNFEGETLSEKAMNYINAKVGVSKETLKAIVDILVEEKK